MTRWTLILLAVSSFICCCHQARAQQIGPVESVEVFPIPPQPAPLYSLKINIYEDHYTYVIKSHEIGDSVVIRFEPGIGLDEQFQYSETLRSSSGVDSLSFDWQLHGNGTADLMVSSATASASVTLLESSPEIEDESVLSILGYVSAHLDRLDELMAMFETIATSGSAYISIVNHRADVFRCKICECCVWEFGTGGPDSNCQSCCDYNWPPLPPTTDCDGFFDSMKCCLHEASRDYCRRLCRANPGSVIAGSVEIVSCVIQLRNLLR